MGKRWPKDKTVCRILLFFIALCMLEGCGKSAEGDERSERSASTWEKDVTAGSELPGDEPEEAEEDEEMMRLYVNEEELSVVWEDNESVDALRELVLEEPLIIEMSVYGGFEQVGPIGQNLPENDRQMTTDAGDIVLYSGNQIVVFYGSNSWSYTRLGHIANKTKEELAQILGQDHVSLKFSLDD